jgi:hypothetical protein
VSRRLAVLVLLCSTAIAQAEIRLGPPVLVGAGSRTPAATSPVRLQAVATSWGYVAVWRRPDGIRAVRISRDGVLLDDPAIVIPSRAPVAHPATDGTDVLIPYISALPSGATIFEIVRLKPDGEVVPFHTLTRQPAAIVWTGKSYIAFLGGCDVTEALQLDRTGAVIRSVRTTLPFYACNDLRSKLFRDATGVLRAIVQRPVLGSTDRFDIGGLTLTNAQGDPVETASVEWINHSGSQVIAAGPTRNGFFLLSRKSIRFFDNAGRAIGGVLPLDTTAPHAADVGGEAVIADFENPGSAALKAWRLGPNGRRLGMAVGAVSTRFKWDITVLPSPNGAAVFWIESSPSMSSSSVMMTLIGRGPAGRLLEPIALERSGADQRDFHAAAHGDGMMAVWSQYGVLGDEVVAAVLDSSASQTGELRRIMPGVAPRIASNGEVALIVTSRSPTSGYAMRVDRDGVPLDKTPIALPLGPREVVWDGSAFIVMARPKQAVRIDEFGAVLTPEPVELTAIQATLPSTIAVSPAGPLFLFMGPRGPGNFASALYAQHLSRDLKPIGAPVVVSILGTESGVAAVWRGDHYRVATVLDGLRTTRISATGEPLDGVFGELVADDGGSSFEIGIVDGRVVVATHMAIVVIDGKRESIGTTGNDRSSRAIVTTRDGRSWLFHVDLNSLPVRAFARELSVIH